MPFSVSANFSATEKSLAASAIIKTLIFKKEASAKVEVDGVNAHVLEKFAEENRDWSYTREIKNSSALSVDYLSLAQLVFSDEIFLRGPEVAGVVCTASKRYSLRILVLSENEVNLIINEDSPKKIEIKVQKHAVGWSGHVKHGASFSNATFQARRLD